MSQTNFTPISIYYSTTASAVPTAANLVQGELAINTADGKLYYEDSSGVVQVLATKGGVGTSSTTQVLYNSSGLTVGSANMTFNGTSLSLANNIGIGGATPTTSGSGITFPATQSASTNANTLDDYEEGTWTPGYTSWLVDPTVATAAKYTKIGRLVNVSVYLTGGTTQAGAQITGLPFTCGTEASMISTNGSNGTLVFYGVVLGSNTVIGSLSAQTLTSTFYAVTATYFTT